MRPVHGIVVLFGAAAVLLLPARYNSATTHGVPLLNESSGAGVTATGGSGGSGGGAGGAGGAGVPSSSPAASSSEGGLDSGDKGGNAKGALSDTPGAGSLGQASPRSNSGAGAAQPQKSGSDGQPSSPAGPNANKEPVPVQPPANPGVDVRTIVLGTVQFETNRAVLSADAQRMLQTVAGSLRNLPNGEVVSIVGHTDAIGSAEANARLSQNRAEAVRDFLIGRGVKASALRLSYVGASAPMANDASAEGRASNRRVVIQVQRS